MKQTPEELASSPVEAVLIAERRKLGAISDVTERDLLRFARHVLLALLLLTLFAMLMYYFSGRPGENEVAAKEIFELVKIGVPPLVSLVIGFYFRKLDK